MSMGENEELKSGGKGSNRIASVDLEGVIASPPPINVVSSDSKHFDNQVISLLCDILGYSYRYSTVYFT